MRVLDRLFKLTENETTVCTEVRAGVVTFLTMSYIVFVQPVILSSTGLSWHTVFVATCVSAAVATLLMGVLANYPIALAAAMGHNVLFAELCRKGIINWQTGLGAVFVSGCLFIILSLWGVREKVINAIPASIKHAIAVGIGLLIAFLGFQWAGLTVDAPITLVAMGNVRMVAVLLALGGLLFTATLIALRLRGAILIGILVTAAVGIPLGVTSTKAIEDQGVITAPRALPMNELLILPVHVPDEVDARTAELSAALRTAAAQHYPKGRAVGESETQERLRRAGISYDGKTTAGQLGELPLEKLGPGTTALPVVTTGKRGVSLAVIAYEVTSKKDKDGKTKTAKAVWRKYHSLPLPATNAQLVAYAKDVVLGLPGYNGLLKFDVLGALKLGILHVIFVFFFLDLFDTIGTLIGVAQQAGFLRDGKLPRARGALLADAFGTVFGAGLGTSTVTSYVESSAGVADGARTGLANVVTALLFLLALFFSPVVKMIGDAHVVMHGGSRLFLYPAVAPVLIIIGSIMLRNVVHIVWSDPTEAIPAFLAIMMMPLTFSITEGIAFGFISYSFLKLVTGRGREAHWLVYVFSLLFLVRYVYVGS